MSDSWEGLLIRALRGAGVAIAAHVPDEVTGGLLESLEREPDFDLVPVTREEEGVGIVSGAFLGGVRGALIMQASGLGNSLNALASLNVPCKIPMLLLIGERGGLGEFNPCQVPGGRASRDWLAAVGIQLFELEDPERVEATVAGAATLAFGAQQPVGLLLTTALTKGKAA